MIWPLFEFENIFDLDLNHGFKFISAAKELQNKFYYPGQPKKVFSPIHRPAHHPLTGLALHSMFMFFVVGLVAFGPSDLASPPAAHFPFHPPPSKQRCCRLVPPAGRRRVVPLRSPYCAAKRWAARWPSASPGNGRLISSPPRCWPRLKNGHLESASLIVVLIPHRTPLLPAGPAYKRVPLPGPSSTASKVTLGLTPLRTKLHVIELQ
jgi:hypothetical protein